jgi:co-chaperonin GroES (HSP10)
VKLIIESFGLKVKILMILSVDNQGVWELVNNWSVRGRTRHVASKAMFLRELKEWGLAVVKYLPGALMSSDLLTKNLAGPLFVKHVANYVTDDDVAVEEAEEQQAREARGTVKSACHKNEVEAQDETNNVRLPSIGNHKANHHEDEEEVRMGEKRLYTDYSQLEVKEQRENGVVMDEGEDEKDWMLGMGTVKNG